MKTKIKGIEILSITTNIIEPAKAEEVIETLEHCINNLDKAEVLFSTEEY